MEENENREKQSSKRWLCHVSVVEIQQNQAQARRALRPAALLAGTLPAESHAFFNVTRLHDFL
eukprot:1823628-Amphidinium_carterae.2